MKHRAAACLLLACLMAGCKARSIPAMELTTAQKNYDSGSEKAGAYTLTDVDSTASGTYMIIQRPGSTSRNLYYVDAATASMQVLCPVQDCDHDSPECPAYFNQGEDIGVMVEGDTLYTVSSNASRRPSPAGGTEEIYELTITARNLDGSGKTVLTQQSVRDMLGENGYIEIVLFWNGSFYVELLSDTATVTMAVVDAADGSWYIEDGIYRAVQECYPDLVNLHCLGSTGYMAVISGFSEVSSGISEYTKYLYNFLTGSVDVITAPFGSDRSGKIIQQGIYGLQPYDDEGSLLVLLYDTYTGETIEEGVLADLNWNDAAGMQIHETFTDAMGNLILVDESQQELTAWLMPAAVREAPTDFVKIKLHTYSYGGEDPYLYTVAQMEDTLLVQLRTQEYSPFTLNYTGMIELNTSYRWQYALLSVDDYINNVPNYRLVTES